MKKLTKLQYFACLLWVLILSVLFMYYLTFAPREESFSETENRMLAAMPIVSVESVFGSYDGDSYERGKFVTDFESYLIDRFPLRKQVISFSQDIRNLASIATYDDFLLFSQGQEDPIDVEEPLLPEPPIFTEAPKPTENSDQNTPEPTAAPITTPATVPVIVEKPEANIDDWPDVMGVYMDIGGETSLQRGYGKGSIHGFTQYLNMFAELLPEGGQLAFMMVPQSVIGNRFLSAEEDDRFYSDFEDFVYAFTADNVQTVSATEILGEGIKRGEYVYFRSDMHWSTYGTYLVYAAAMEALGREPTDWDDYVITSEEPFLGTYHRDNPSSYFSDNPDRLDLYELPGDVIMERAVGDGTFEIVPLLDMDAAQNDRFTVFMGGPDDYAILRAEEQSGQEGKCLIITDSFGISFAPLLTGQYEEVHYVDPRYYNAANGSLTTLFAEHDFTDCFVVVGDLHSFDNNFLLSASYLIG